MFFRIIWEVFKVFDVLVFIIFGVGVGYILNFLGDINIKLEVGSSGMIN